MVERTDAHAEKGSEKLRFFPELLSAAEFLAVR